MAVQAVGNTPTSRHPSSYNLGIHKHPASAGLDRPHGGAAACICTGASAAGNTEARQVNTQARVESAPPRHADGGTAAKHLPARCHRCGLCSAGTQAHRSPAPRISFRFVPSHRFRLRPPARGRSTADPDAAQHPPSPTDTPRHERPGLHRTASRALGGQAMDPRRSHQAGQGPMQVSRCGAQR